MNYDFLNKVRKVCAMLGNYEERKIDQTKVGDYTISTAYVFDFECYETAIHKADNDWIVVEHYPTKEESVDGHSKWCDFCKGNPTEVYDIYYKKISKFDEVS